MRESGWKVKIGWKHACRRTEAGLSCEADPFLGEQYNSETGQSHREHSTVRDIITGLVS